MFRRRVKLNKAQVELVKEMCEHYANIINARQLRNISLEFFESREIRDIKHQLGIRANNTDS